MKTPFFTVIFIAFTFQIFGQKTDNSTIFEPVPTWVKSYPKPKLKKEYDLSLVRVHREYQYNHITGEDYYRCFFYINDEDGISELGSFSNYYEPAYQTLHLHKVAIYRANETINLTDDLHTQTILFDEKVGTTQYGDDAKFIIYFDRLNVGDLVEIAYTEKGKQPDFHNRLSYQIDIEQNDFIGKTYSRVLNYPDKLIHHKLLNSNEKPTIKKHKDYYEFEFATSINERLQPTDKHWYISHKKLYITDISSWKEIVDITLKNHQLEVLPSKPIQNKVKSLTKGINNKDQQITAILDFIQRDIEYLEYGLIEPNRPDITLDKGYGDCKSMSLLTIKMLECIGVNAYPVLVHSKGIDDRLIHSHAFMFDHEVIEFIHKGDTILFDATADFVKGLSYKRAVNDFRYGLRTLKGVNELTRFPNQTEGQIIYNETKTVKRNYFDELEYNSNKEIIFEGNLARKLYELKEKVGLKKMWNQGVKDHYTNTWCFLSEDLIQTHSFQYIETKPQFTITLDNQECNSFQIYQNEDGDILKSYPNLLKSWWYNFDVQDDSPLIEVLPFNDVLFNYKIVLEDSISIESDSIFIKNDWLEYKQIIEQKGKIIYATYHIKVLKPYLPNERFDEIKKVIEQIQEDMVIYIDKRYLPKQPKWKSPEHYIPQVIILSVLLTFIGLIWWIIRTLRKRKKRIMELESEVEKLTTLFDESQKVD